MNVRRNTAATMMLLSLVAGCEGSSPATTQAVNELPTADVILAGHQFKLEIADDPKEREKGLMNRKTMAVDHGMLFAFPDVDQRAFWMKNTLIPLDIAFLDARGNVLNVAKMYPNDLSNVNSVGEAKYAIELNQGVSEKIGLKAGDHIELPKTSPE